MPFWFILDQVADSGIYPLRLSCLSLAMIQLSAFRFHLIGSMCRNRFIGFWLYTPFRVLLWYFCTMDGSFKNDPPVGVSLLFAYLFLASLTLITPCQSVIVQYLHLVREYPSAQLCQDRRAVLIVPCSLFACWFFVDWQITALLPL